MNLAQEKIFCLIGYPLGHSFSAKYFNEKIFPNSDLPNYNYELCEMENISNIRKFLEERENIFGLNVTVPHKKNIMSFLDEISDEAKEIGAVNCVKVSRKNNEIFLSGFNTDVYGFEKSLNNFLSEKISKAIILGTGGSAMAAAFVLNKKNIEYVFVSRNNKNNNTILYNELNEKIFHESNLIINCTPLGMFPNTENFPPIPYEFISENHFCFDMVYNPAETEFLKKCKIQNLKCKIQNGLKMLYHQADQSYDIWNK